MTSRDTRADPRKQRTPALNGAVVVDTPNGRLRVRKWPRKRGPSKSQQVREQNQWFKNTVRELKYADAGQVNQAIEVTKGTGLLPRDMLMRAMSEGFYDIIEPDGQVITYRQKGYNPVTFQGLIAPVVDGTVLPAATLTTLPMDVPTLDTAGFWSAGDPTKITIPDHVQVIRINAALLCKAANASDLAVLINPFPLASALAANVSEFMFTNPGVQASTGPIVVNQGDQFVVRARSVAANSIETAGSNIQVEILETF